MKRAVLVFFATLFLFAQSFAHSITAEANDAVQVNDSNNTDSNNTDSNNTEEAPHHPGPRSTLEENTLKTEGLNYFEANDWALSILSLDRLLSRYPSTKDAVNLHRQLGVAHFHQKSFARALPELRIYILQARRNKTLHISPLLADSYLKSAQSYLELTQTSLASTAIEELLKLKPEITVRDQALILKTRIQLAKGDLKRAQRTFDAISNIANTGTLRFELKLGECQTNTLKYRAIKPGSNPESEAEDQDGLSNIMGCYQEALTKNPDTRWCDAIKKHEVKLLHLRSVRAGFTESHREKIREVFSKLQKEGSHAGGCP